MKKYIADVLTGIRIVFAVILLFLPGFSAVFITLYAICALTDILDGPIARATGSESIFGAKLDTAADVLFALALVKVLLVNKVINWFTILWFFIAALGLIASAIIAKIRFGRFFFIHTLTAKAMGAGAFATPVFVLLKVSDVYIKILWFFVWAASIEAVIIQLSINHPDSDILSVFLVKRANKKYVGSADAVNELK